MNVLYTGYCMQSRCSIHLQPSNDEVEEEGHDGEQVDEVHGAHEELQLAGGTREPDLKQPQQCHMSSRRQSGIKMTMISYDLFWVCVNLRVGCEEILSGAGNKMKPSHVNAQHFFTREKRGRRVSRKMSSA